MHPTAVAVAILAVWRVTHLIQAEDGPWDVVARLRRAAGAGVLGRLLDCFYCLSLWVAAPAALWVATDWLDRVVLWFAISGAAILLERVTEPKATFLEDPPPDRPKEEADVVLRKDETASRGSDVHRDAGNE